MRRTVRLMREVNAPWGSGPGNGQYALQKALRVRAPDWLRIGGALQWQEIPWWWCWLDRDEAVRSSRENRPFVMGPNILFGDWRRPFASPGERELCTSASCALQYTESPWYRDLIARHSGPPNRAPIVIWPYPIDPQPAEPLAAKHDLLIYEKGLRGGGLSDWLVGRYPRSIRFRYGSFRREELGEAARQSRACAYLSQSDRGPLALAEILLAGCPAIGTPRGAPWIVDGLNGHQVSGFGRQSLSSAIARAQALDRRAVRSVALEQFHTDRIVDAVLSSLKEALDRVEAGHR